MLPLPIDEHLSRILQQLRTHRRIVIVAEPGAGKTTRVPPAIIRHGVLPTDQQLIMLQPRRVAARAAASRIAAENGWKLGQEVGYQVRGERRMSKDTAIRILTEGILTPKLIADPFLEGVGCVVLDEFHERHIDSDLCIAMLREICDSVRDDLHLVVMSATIDAESVASFLGGCPIIEVPGRLFPVDIRFAPPPATAGPKMKLSQHVAREVRGVLDGSDEQAGDILVFLPGIEEIRRTADLIQSLAESHGLLVLPLHGALPFDAQARVLEPSDRRKLILATNIAETSLTIDGVRTVIDSGLARIASYDPRRGMDRLELQRISRASATQRSGRAGRTAPGQCIRLWSAAEDRHLSDFQAPEVRRVDLAAAILHLHQWGQADPRQFGWFERPADHAIASAERLLTMLGAISSGRITPLGERIAEIPAHPRLARLMVAAAEHDLIHPAATFAALMSEKDILLASPDLARRLTRQTQGRSDLLYRMQLLETAEQSRFDRSLRDQGIDPFAAHQVARTRDDLLRQFRSNGRTPFSLAAMSPTQEDALLKLILLTYPDRLCRRRGDSDSATMVGGFGVRIDPGSTVALASLFVAIDARDDHRSHKREAVSRILSEVDPDWLGELLPQMLGKSREVSLDESSGRVSARIIHSYADLAIEESVDHSVRPEDISAALATAARRQAREIFAADRSAAQLLQRLAFLREHVPEQNWPAFDDAALGEILARSCTGRRSLQEIRNQDLAELLLSEMEWKMRQRLDELAPQTLTVPTGNRIRLEYSAGKQPTLSVRLQEIFGWLKTPCVAGGRVPVLMELLGPNYRPVQLTSDLASFWKTTYFEVRKDLRVRYPKHAWPDDPLTAQPQAKGRPKR